MIPFFSRTVYNFLIYINSFFLEKRCFFFFNFYDEVWVKLCRNLVFEILPNLDVKVVTNFGQLYYLQDLSKTSYRLLPNFCLTLLIFCKIWLKFRSSFSKAIQSLSKVSFKVKEIIPTLVYTWSKFGATSMIKFGEVSKPQFGPNLG